MGVENIEHNELIETLKRLIQADKVMVRQMKRTIAEVDRNLHRSPESPPERPAQSERDQP